MLYWTAETAFGFKFSSTFSFCVVTYTSGRQPVVRGPLMVRKKILVVRGEIWTLFAIFMFIILISNKQQQISH
jgi:hypothetical protein